MAAGFFQKLVRRLPDPRDASTGVIFAITLIFYFAMNAGLIYGACGCNGRCFFNLFCLGVFFVMWPKNRAV